MDRVISDDGTPIAFERQGSGPPVVLVSGGLADRSENAPLAAELAGSFTVYNYDRRGRSGSGDTQPYAVEREIEDITALIASAGGSAHLYGVSSGGALVLEAAAAGLAVDRLAVYDVPYSVGDDMADYWQEYTRQLAAVLAVGQRGQALALFMRLNGASDDDIAAGQTSAMWEASVALEHTLAYDAACLGDGRPPVAQLAAITRPVLVLTGETTQADAEMSALPDDFFGQAADAVAASIPQAVRQVLPGQGHVADPGAAAAVLRRFFTSQSTSTA
jgi:pimeloyl-ACP methyl ester carboxylesterase